MADKQKSADTEVSQAPADAGGVEAGAAEPGKVRGAEHAGVVRESKVAGGRPDGPILTAEPSREADKTSYPVPNDAQPEDPPVRTTRPDVPIAVSLASGAGEHMPPDPERYTPDGRPRLDR
jgi:hypothetical protein